MEYNIIFYILQKQYDLLSYDDFFIISKYPEIFGLGDDFNDLLKTNSNKDEIVDYISKNILPRYEILNRVDSKLIIDNNLDISFKQNLFDNLGKMDIVQLCFFIDQVGIYVRNVSKYRYKFFGPNYKVVDFYHKLNEIICKNYNVPLVFNVFNKAHKGMFLWLDFNKFDKEAIINLLDKRLIHHFYLLNEIAIKILQLDTYGFIHNKEKIKFPMTRSINKDIELFDEIIKEEVQKNRDNNIKVTNSATISLLVDDLYEEGEDDD